MYVDGRRISVCSLSSGKVVLVVEPGSVGEKGRINRLRGVSVQQPMSRPRERGPFPYERRIHTYDYLKRLIPSNSASQPVPSAYITPRCPATAPSDSHVGWFVDSYLRVLYNVG